MAEKLYWKKRADALNAELERERKRILGNLKLLPECSHLGSNDPRIYVPVKEVYEDLHDPKNDLSDRWKKSSLEITSNSFEESPEPYCLSVAEREILRKTLIPGDKCRRCTKERARMAMYATPCISFPAMYYNHGYLPYPVERV